MKTISVSNTINVPISGKPSAELISINGGDYSSVMPSLIPFITVKLAVKKGDELKIGSVVFYDKKDSDLVFVSPVCGVVEEIVYGKKRKIDHVIIKHNAKSEEEIKKSFSQEDIKSSNEKEIREAILKGGLWGSFREFPFNNVPKSDAVLPQSIYIAMDNDEPYYPEPKVYLKDNVDDFNFAIEALNKLFQNVNIGVSDNNSDTKNILDGIYTHSIKGHYPANSPSKFLYVNKKDAKDNNSFSIDGQDVLKIGKLLKTGKYPTTKIITLAGSLLDNPSHLKVNEGASMSAILQNENISNSSRVIAGGVYKGRTSSATDSLGFGEYAVHILGGELKQDIFPFFKPGFDKPTNSNTYLSFLLPKKEIKKDISLYGEPRSCIACDYCVQACPAELLPQFLMKELYANERANALSLGMLDCDGCGACTYVCPSKIELAEIITEAKDGLYKELNQ